VWCPNDTTDCSKFKAQLLKCPMAKKRKSDQPFAEKHLKEYSGINASYA